MTKPIIPIDPKGLDDVADALLKGETIPGTDDRKPSPARIKNPNTYLILPGKIHGSYSYPDLLVPTSRTHLNENWDQCFQGVVQEGSLMLTPRQYADFLAYLKGGRVYDGSGSRVDSGKITAILDDILTVRSPYRAEWLDAKFSKGGIPVVRETWNITYHKIKSDGTLEKVTEPLQECLRDNKLPGIDLDYWLGHATQQGLPPKNNSSGNVYYWHPKDGAVARFGADSGRARLFCYGDPTFSNAGLGVRAAKIKR